MLTLFNNLERKLSQQLGQLLKKITTNKDPHNTVFINSFPKSGTHLLYQLFDNNPSFLTDYKTFIVSSPSFSQLKRSNRKIINMINSIVNSELVRAHLYFDVEFEKLLINKKFVQYFIYRDPRDVVISEANYLYYMNKWHRLHKYYNKFPSIDDRIMFSIKGNSFFKTPIDYPNIFNRFEKYKGWLDCDSVYPIKYEAIVGEDKENEIKKIMSHYLDNSNENFNLTNLVKTAIMNINTKKSHTFFEGGTQKWKKYFIESHKKAFKEISGDLLIELGYEKDLNW